MIATAENLDHYLAESETLRAARGAHSPPWLDNLRKQALGRFAELGFPSRKDEDWKYTNVRPIAERRFQRVDEECLGLIPDDIEHLLVADCHRLTFVNGRFAPQLSRPGEPGEGIRIQSLAQVLRDEPQAIEALLSTPVPDGADGFAALNTALMADGACLRVEPGRGVGRPIHLLFLAAAREDAAALVRNLLVLEPGAEATVIESYASLGDAAYFTSAVTQVVLADAARLAFYRVQEESAEAFHVATVQIRQGRDSRLDSHWVAMGARLARTGVNIDLAGEGAECTLNGLYATDGRQHVDFHTRIDHRVPHGTSRELFKGILAGQSRGVFDGKVYVHPDAQRTDAQQANHNLLLSQHAEADTKPQLEIFADDVKCSHGATVGQLDPDKLFYLRSRGLDEAEARGLLTYGFAREILDRIAIPELRERLGSALLTRVGGSAASPG